MVPKGVMMLLSIVVLFSLLRRSTCFSLQLPVNGTNLQLPTNETNDASNGIHTSSGLIEGHMAPNRPEVMEYLGIPFAKPPVGNLRFAAPQAFRGSGRYIASRFVCKPCHSATIF